MNGESRLACLCGLLLGLSIYGRAEERPLTRSRMAVEGLLGNIEPALSPLPGAPSFLPDIPAPLPPGVPVQAAGPKELMPLAAETVLGQAQEIDRRSSLRGQEYFSAHPDSPKIKAAFRDAAGSCRAPEPCVVQVGERTLMYENGAELNRWYPRIGPIRGYRTTYSPANGETHPPLIEVELQLDKSLYERLFQEAQQLFGPAFFKDEKAAAERLAFLLAPRAAADLELSRLLDEQKIPDGIWVDEIEELRLSWEVAALRAQIAMHEAMLSDPGFKFLPAELDYLARRFGEKSFTAVLAPQEALFADQAEEDWGTLRGRAPGTFFILELKSQAPDERLQDKSLQSAQHLLGELQRQLHAGAVQRNILLQFRLQKAEGAEAYLAQPGVLARLREALRRERGRANSFPFLPDSAKARWTLHGALIDATAAAEDFDLDGAESRLRGAEAAARRGGLNYDIAAARESLKKRYFTVDRGLELFKKGDSEQRGNVIRSFGAMGVRDEDAIKALQGVLVNRNDKPAMRAEAAESLGKMGPSAIPALMTGLDDFSPNVQNAVERALTDEASASLPLLAEAVGNPSYQNDRRAGAALALGRIGAPAVPACVLLLKNRDLNARLWAALALKSMGPSAEGAAWSLEESLEGLDGRVQKAAYLALAAIGPAAGPAWIKALQSPDPHVRGLAGEELLNHLNPPSPEIIGKLIGILRDHASAVRGNAIEILRAYGPAARQAVPALQRMKDTDANPGIRLAAARALRAILKDGKR